MERTTIDIREIFKDKATVTKAELSAYIHSIDSNANDASIRQRISRYKRSGLIVSVKRGVYAYSNKPVYTHPADNFIAKLSKIFSAQYPEINYCIWSSAWLYDITIHQPAQFFYIFETEYDIVEILFNLLKDNGYHAFLNPDEQTMQLYVMGMKNPVVVKPLLMRAPLVVNKTIKLPSLEKMLVDAYLDKRLFYFLQGIEMQNIFRFSFSKYSINISSLVNYALRRGKKSEITDFAKRNVPFLNNLLIND